MASSSSQQTPTTEEIDALLLEHQRTVAFDTKDYTAELLVSKLLDGDMYIPSYQREFIWSTKDQSKFIESVLIGLPIPFMFAAENEEGRLEILDGAQRVQTLRDFLHNSLSLEALEKLYVLNGFRFKDLSPSQQRRLKNRTLRLIVISPNADIDVRFDLFERINSHGRKLKPAELRRGAFPGPFYDILLGCASNERFKKQCPMSTMALKHRENEELVLRFFAYSERYTSFNHDVAKFLNNYLREKNAQLDPENEDRGNAPRDPQEIGTDLRACFDAMLSFVETYFANGFAKSKSATTTPRVRFEAISVGVHLALQENPELVPASMEWLSSDEFKNHTTTHASNSGPKLAARVEYVRDRLLGR